MTITEREAAGNAARALRLVLADLEARYGKDDFHIATTIFNEIDSGCWQLENVALVLAHVVADEMTSGPTPEEAAHKLEKRIVSLLDFETGKTRGGDV